MRCILVSMKSISFKQIAYAIAVAEGLSFDIEEIIAAIAGAFMGNPAGDIAGAMMQQIYDAFVKVTENPLQAGIDVGTKVAVVYASFWVLRTILSAMGAPQSKKIGGITVRWT